MRLSTFPREALYLPMFGPHTAASPESILKKENPNKVLSLRLPAEVIQPRERARQAWAAGESQAAGLVDADWLRFPVDPKQWSISGGAVSLRSLKIDR